MVRSLAAIAVMVGGMLYITQYQCTSSPLATWCMTKASDWVPSGVFVHSIGGDMPSPSQVYCTGNTMSSLTTGLRTVNPVDDATDCDPLAVGCGADGGAEPVVEPALPERKR